MLLDLHVHLGAAPGEGLAPREALARARAAGLDGVCFAAGSPGRLAELRAAGREEGMVALLALELAAAAGRFLCVLPDPERAPPLPPPGEAPWPAARLIEGVRGLGGAVVALHPYDRALPPALGDAIFELDGLAAVEGLHGRSPLPANDLAVEAADHLHLPCVGGSGALAPGDEIGRAATLLRRPVGDEAGLAAQLRAGRVHAAALSRPGQGFRSQRTSFPSRNSARR